VEINVSYGFYNGVFSYGGSTQLLDTQFPAQELAFQKVMDARTPQPLPPPAPLSTQQSQQMTLGGTSLMGYVQQQTLQYILGKRPLSQWSQFQSELSGKGTGTFLNTFNSAYATYNKKFG
jgi:putative aldouronate transport system substrate-binding protein